MANVLVNESSLSAIANAIRAKNCTETKYKPTEMSDAISAIQAGAPEETITLATDFTNLSEALSVFDALKNTNDNCTAFISKKYLDVGIGEIIADGLVAVVISKTNASSLGWWRRSGNGLYHGTGGYAGYTTKAKIGDVFVKKVLL